MSTHPYVLGIDCSTSSAKAIVWDLTGQIVSSGRASIAYKQPTPGWAEQEATWWWKATVEATQEAMAQIEPSQVMAVGLTWQRETWVPLNADGEPLRDAMLWMDARGEQELAELRKRYGEEFCDLTGKPLDVTPSIFKILWMRRHEPELYAKTDTILDVGAYLSCELTGEFRTCSAGADTMGLMDMRTRSWSDEFLSYAGLDKKQLPELIEPGQLLGHVNAEAARLTGLLEGTPVIAGGGDGQCSAIGTSVLDPDTYGISLGTGLSMNVHMTDYVADKAFRTLVGCVPNSYLAEVNTRACSLIVQWYVREFGRLDQDLADRLDTTIEDAIGLRMEEVPPGADGLLTLPFWRGAMMPHNKPLVRGVTLGWSDYHTRAHFYRSLLEGLSFEFRFKLEAIERALDQPCRVIRIAGGGSQSREWCQIISDVTHKVVEIAEKPDSTALGAAILAATAVGAFDTLQSATRAMTATTASLSPREENLSIYNQIYEQVYVHLLPTLENTLTTLKQITTRT